MSSFRGTFTTTVTNGSFTIPEGALEIMINNIGAGDANYTGTERINGIASTAVTIAANTTYTLGYIGAPRKEVVINAPATTIEITVTR